MKISIVYDYKDIKDSQYFNEIKALKKEIRNCIICNRIIKLLKNNFLLYSFI